MRTTGRIAALDGLRGVAAAIVVVHHCVMVDPSVSRAFSSDRASGAAMWALVYTPLRLIWAGPEAVWVFFVLSGYVLTRRYVAGATLEPRSYYPRRVVRLYLPLFGAAILAVLLRLVPHRVVPGGGSWLNGHAAPVGIREAGGTLLLLFGNRVQLNSVWWSLQWEVWFSLLLPVVVVAALALREHPVAIGAVSLAAAVLGPAVANGHTDPQLFGAITCLPVFGLGVSVAGLEQRLTTSDLFHRRPQLGRLAVAGCVVGITANAPIIAVGRAWHLSATAVDATATLCVLSAATGFVVLAITFEPVERFLCSAPNAWLGLRSYSLYLVHEPIIVATAFAFRVRSFPLWFPAVTVAASLAVAMAFHRLVEAPSVDLARRVGRRSTRVA